MASGERQKLIVVSNRGPVSYYRDEDGKRAARRGAGGLVTALGGLLSHHDVTWIASAMSDEDRTVAAEAQGVVEETGRDGSPYRLHLVPHDPAAYDAFYNVVANPTLWFVQHYLWDLVHEPTLEGRLREAWETGYVPVNRAFAAAVLAELDREPGATVWFHDYHLYVAPRLVRDAQPDAMLAHFIHIPWAQPDYWGVLPAEMRWAIHDGLLANNVVSFHTRRWRRSFLRACEDFVDAHPDYTTMERIAYGERDVLVTARPISVDPDEFDALADAEAVLSEERAIEEQRPEFLILRVDRTDPSKNVVRGFRAFELYLEAHPEMHGRVGMLALLNPSRQDIRHYSQYGREIEEAVSRVNTRFGRDGWQPIRAQLADNFLRAVAAYKQFDVLLVNSIFDGLNLVAKEAPLMNRRGGVLVLSENAGAHEELGEWALTINPFDVAEQADALHEALTMPAGERRRRLDAICNQVRGHTLAEWSWLQMEDIAKLRSLT